MIDYFLSRSRVYAQQPRFGGIPDQGLIAIASRGTLIVFNRPYEAEHFAQLAGIFPHEVIHHDAVNTGVEESILNGLSALVHMQILARHPELATTGTELSRQMNDLVLLLVNSRAPGSSRIAIVAPTASGVAPGSAPNGARLLHPVLEGPRLVSQAATASPPQRRPPRLCSPLCCGSSSPRGSRSRNH